MYRGENGPLNLASLQSPPCDLLLPNTYPTNGAVAADYFASLDAAMQKEGLLVHPSIAHLATSDIMAASQWGVAQSVWPLDEGLHFAVLAGDEDAWWQDRWALVQAAAPRSSQSRPGPAFWRDAAYMQEFVRGEVRVDAGLANALSRGSEVMFTGSRYLSVPLSQEPALLRRLRVPPLPPRTPVLQAPPMQVDDVKRGRPSALR
eukprot:gene43082-52651_t